MERIDTTGRARWARVQALFHRATELPSPDRDRFLEEQTEDDPSVAAEVAAMLRADAATGGVLGGGVAEAADRLLGSGSGPAKVGPYRIVSVLGEGGMGVVYLGERDDLETRAAIKILPDAWLSPARRERFEAERRTLAQLDHPAIARLLDADAFPDGTPWFVMEYVEGLPITRYCQERGSSLRSRLLLFRAVCEAVLHAHQHAVIHRDLKPSNILVRSDGAVKLLDFGIAKQLDSLDTQADQTQTGLRLLTPAYASPEQIRGDRVGIRTDVYSLGVVLYELLAGRLPHDLTGLTPSEALDLVVNHTPIEPSVMARAVAARGGGAWLGAVPERAWADLDVICLTAMHRDPERRFRTVDALIRDIDHFLAGEPLEARRDSAGYRLGKFVRRHRGAVAAAVTVLAGAIGIVTFYTVRLRAARNAAVLQAARTERIQGFMVNLFRGGDDAVAPADSLRVVALLEEGLREAASLDREPAVQAELYQTLGGVYQQLGKLDRADSLLTLSLAKRRALRRPDQADVGKTLVAFGELMIDRAQLDSAVSLIRAGLAEVAVSLPADHPTVLDSKLALGRALQEKGEYEGAIAVLGEVLAASAGDTTSRDYVLRLTELANAHFYAGHYPTADSMFRRALGIDTVRFGNRHPLVAEDLINIGHVQQDLGAYSEAERYFRSALAVTESWYGPNHPKTALNLTVVGRSLQYQRRLEESAALLERALAIQERVYGPVHLRVASTLTDLGSVATLQDRPDLAEARQRRVVEIYRAIHGNRHQHLGVAISNLGSAVQARKDFPAAEALFREAVAIFEATVGPTHLNTAIAQIKLGRSLLRQRRFEEAVDATGRGYQILVKSVDPGNNFLRAARIDLAAAYDSLGSPTGAARFKAELADTTPKR